MIDKLKNWYFSKNALPYWCILLLDCAIVIASGYVAHYFVFRAMSVTTHVWGILLKYCFFLIFYLAAFRIFRTYLGVFRYSSFTDLMKIAEANALAALACCLVRISPDIAYLFCYISYREIILSAVVATVVMGAFRIFIKYLYDSMRTDVTKRVFIYGTHTGGVGIAKLIKNQQPKRFSLQGFVTDDKKMKGHTLMGVDVVPNDDKLIDIMTEARATVLLVSPLKTKDLTDNQEMIDHLMDAGIQIFITKSAEEWDGKSDLQATQLKEVQIEDLLPRDEIKTDKEKIAALFKGKKVMVTGSAGSIGSEIVRQVAAFEPEQMILIDSAETPQHSIRLMMAKEFPGVKAETIVTSIVNKERMEHIFAAYKPDCVLHAAAYKHVPMMEDNPCESVTNNIEGTMNIADLAVKYGTNKFVMISTDKAVNPTNVMGCSKRICEIYVQSLDKAIKEGKIQGHTQFVTTRFGNVLGSNGSVIPLFEKQIKNGGPVTVTDPNIIRYFMLIPEACNLVLEAAVMGKGGEIYVFDMGKPVKIADLAKRMIKLSGAKDVEIKYTGLREGEKLYEELLSNQEETLPTFNEKVRIAKVREYDFKEVKSELQELIKISLNFDKMETVAMMKKIVPEFRSNNSIYEKLDKASPIEN